MFTRHPTNPNLRKKLPRDVDPTQHLFDTIVGKEEPMLVEGITRAQAEELETPQVNYIKIDGDTGKPAPFTEDDTLTSDLRLDIQLFAAGSLTTTQIASVLRTSARKLNGVFNFLTPVDYEEFVINETLKDLLVQITKAHLTIGRLSLSTGDPYVHNAGGTRPQLQEAKWRMKELLYAASRLRRHVVKDPTGKKGKDADALPVFNYFYELE